MSEMTLTYGDLSIGRKVQNIFTGEQGEITALGNGLVEITLTSGPDSGEEITGPPIQVATTWHKR